MDGSMWKLRTSRTKLEIEAKSENGTLERGYHRPHTKYIFIINDTTLCILSLGWANAREI